MDVTSKVILGLDPNEFRKGIQQVDASLKQTSKMLTNLGGLIGAAFAGSEIMNFTKEAINLAAEAQNVQVAFANIGTAGQLMQLQAATDGEISKLQLMERAVKAVGQGTGIDQLSKQLEYANALSDATGMAFDEIADKLQTAFAKESTKGLEQVGINVKELKEQIAAGVPYAEALGAAMQKTLDTIGPGAESAADALDRQRASIEDLKLQIGTALLPVYSGFLSFVAEGLKAITTLLSGQLTLWQRLAYVASYANVTGGAEIRMYLDGLKAANTVIQDTTMKAPALGASLTSATDEATTGLKKATTEAVKFRDTLSSMLSLAQQFASEDLNFVAKGEVLGGFQPIDIEELDMMEGQLVPLIETVKNFNGQLQAAATIGQMFGNVLTEAFSASITNGEDFFAVLKKAVIDYVKQMAAAVAATLALSAIVSAFTGMPLGVTFRAVSQGTGLGNLFGDGGVLNMTARVSGRDTLLTNLRNGTDYSRILGG
jgi:hypothetical protein